MFEPYIRFFQSGSGQITLKFLYYSAFVWVPGLLLFWLWEMFVDYKRAQYMAKQTYVLLEIKLPKEIFKSPRAAEFFIAGMNKKDFERNWHEIYLKGQSRQDFSLEIASIDGAIHFFIRARKAQKNIIEANIYSQYPGVEIYEVPDYTLPVTFNPDVHGLTAFEFDLTKADAYPIKTYMDYGMDKDPKEEFKIDPLTPLIEFMASLGRGQQAWFQIIIRAHKEEDVDPKTGKAIDKRWKKGAEDEIVKIQESAKGEKGADGKFVPGMGRQLNENEQETIKALGRSLSKVPFDVGMRIIYTAPKDIFVGANIGGMIGGIAHFNSNNLNGFKPARGSSDNIPFFNKYFGLIIPRSEKARNKERQEMLDAYKRRAYFFKPYKRPYFVLNSEELATLYHFPGQVSTTPTFGRIGSKKAEAPVNIPV
ncbi:MAG: hypothetical protein V4473_00620 [Patescibacteria group bacterium]